MNHKLLTFVVATLICVVSQSPAAYACQEKMRFEFLSRAFSDLEPSALPKNKKQYSENLEKATAGDSRAQFNIAYLLLSGKGQHFGIAYDEKKAISLLVSANQASHVRASVLLGILSFWGRALKQDYAASKQYFLQDGQNSEPWSKALLGFIEEEGFASEANLAVALRHYRISADRGNGFAQFRLGRLHELGMVVKKDTAEAERYYKLSADRGFPEGQIALANLYANKGSGRFNLDKAVAWYQIAADNRSPAAKRELARLYDLGIGVPQDKQKAVELYDDAAFWDNEALFILAIKYLSGDGVEQDLDRAKGHLRELAHADCENARLKLTEVLLKTAASPSDYKEAYKWAAISAEQGIQSAIGALKQAETSLETQELSAAQHELHEYFFNRIADFPGVWLKYLSKSAENGLIKAQLDVGNRYTRGYDVSKSEIDAQKWYLMAANQEHAGAQSEVASYFVRRRDMNQAIYWFKRAASNSSEHMFMLGQKYIYGLYMPEGNVFPYDVKKGMQAFEQAAAKGNVMAMMNLGYIYRRGHYVPKNPKQAYEWFLKAKQHGRGDASTEIRDMIQSGEISP